ncbi:polymeric immunoglobulin receptor-like [Colossoma macropomum]|uniref:polymeric immunoglobulin receptor-like n=1 Tax=Colossoma macropomum TaxID=42526 RepID=UPI0018649F86|nr:polymeric immunoglobulin receptor-like [Colossoma macropomum]
MSVFKSSVRMQVLICLLLTVLHVTEGCTLENSGRAVYETAYTGGSVLLPCYCTDQQTKPEIFTWKKYNTSTWEEISSDSGQYRNRVQLVNGHSPGNLSLLISHLTEEDEGGYKCDVKDIGHTYIHLTVEGCTLENSGRTVYETVHTGGSVLLPCYCTNLQTKPEIFTWKKYNTSTWEEISSESGQYRNRVQLVNGHSPGNLSLLISHLTEEDEGDYKCDVKDIGHTYIHLTVEGCTLENSGRTVYETVHTGGSVLLPCYCTNLQTKPEIFTWKKYNTSTWEEISSESGQYRNRVQLVNGHSPGNLSLLISHLTEEDEGDYKCDVKDIGHTYIHLTVEGCTLENSETYQRITAHTGGSVLLPCSCINLQTKPEIFTWKKYNTDRNTWEEIFSESGQYRNRVQLVNGHSPGNLSLLISHLTEEDGGGYRCEPTGNEYKNIKLFVEGKPPRSLPFVPFALVTVIFLHIIVAVVYHTKRNKGTNCTTNSLYSCYCSFMCKCS